MRTSTLVCRLAAAILPLALAGPAPKVTDNPTGVQYIATLPNTTTTTGNVLIGPGPGGDGASIQVSFAGLPTEGGPFLYHIHEKFVDSTGNCSSAGKHLDPYGNNGTGCDSADLASCEVGDLSGKHGKVNGTTGSQNYIDDYVSVKSGDKASVEGLSIVVHFANKTAITCANLTLNGGSAGGSTGGNDVLPGDNPAPKTSTVLPATTTLSTPETTAPPESGTTELSALGAQATVGIAAALAGVIAMAL